MAAGQGFKTFTTGEVLTAGDVNGYLMQGVLVFASTAARDAAITSPAEGQFAFTKDTNGLWYYDGAVWVASGATGDIEGVTAGIGISGGGTSGTVTVTNSMATAIDAKGDLVAGTGADTFAKLTVGANGTVLTAASGQATGLEWATPSSGGMTLISTTSLTSTSVTISSIPQTYNNLYIIIKNFFSNTANRKMIIKPNGTSSIANFTYNAYNGSGTTSDGANGTDLTTLQVSESTDALRNIYVMNIYNYTDAVAGKVFDWKGTMADNSSIFNFAGTFTTATTISSLVFTLNGAGSFNGGSVLLYGVK
jgi:hypothetical protein